MQPAQIVAELPRTAVVVLSMHSDASYVSRALDAGIKGFVLKESAESVLLMASDTVACGSTFLQQQSGPHIGNGSHSPNAR
jgi:two-component system, NarL family, response regulator NreC